MTPAQIAELRRLAEALRDAQNAVPDGAMGSSDVTYLAYRKALNKYEEGLARFPAATLLSLLAERDALVRVAEAAKRIMPPRPDLYPVYASLAGALAALAAIQEKPDAPTGANASA